MYLWRGLKVEITIKSPTHGESTVLIDDEDYDKIKAYTWNINKVGSSYYFQASSYKGNSSKRIRLHRFIMNCPSGMTVDHINHNTFDNRKCNLRICTMSENNKNVIKHKNGLTSNYKGVHFKKTERKFIALIMHNRKREYLGRFKTEDQELLKVLNNIDQDFLNRNKVVCWNAFFEVIRNWLWKVVELLPILSSTIEVMEDWDGYRQNIGTDVVYFNDFTPMADRPAKALIYEQSKAKPNELVNTWKWCWYNPNLNEVYQFKNVSLSTKYYWASFFESPIDQLILLWQIDKYYWKWFDNGMIKTKIIYPIWEKNSFSASDKESLRSFIKWKMKGIDKAFWTAILDKEIWQQNLEHEIDANAFIEYRKELLKSISIALNVPYDMLLSDNSNRASSQVSLESFNQFTIRPLQQQNLHDFKKIFAEWYNTEDLDYMFIDTKDEKEQMEIYTWYKKAWIFTPNEIRKKLGYDPIEWWDILQTEPSKNNVQEIIKQESKSFYNELTSIENDLYKNL